MRIVIHFVRLMSHVEQRKQKNMELASSVLPHFTIEDLIKHGAHFGHKASACNYQMKPYIFGVRNGVHIIDVRKTHANLITSLLHLYKSVRAGKSVLMVSTKRNVRDIVKKYAVKCGQPYVAHRWLGGMLTNWRTIVMSIKKIKKFEKILSELDEKGRHSIYAKKEINVIKKELEKLKVYFDGLKGVTSRPDIVIVFDTNKDSCAVEEAEKLCISSIGVVDTNSSLDNLQYYIPCNDDSAKAVDFVANLICETILKAIKDEVSSYKVDLEMAGKAKQDKIAEISEKVKSSIAKKA